MKPWQNDSEVHKCARIVKNILKRNSERGGIKTYSKVTIKKTGKYWQRNLVHLSQWNRAESLQIDEIIRCQFST